MMLGFGDNNFVTVTNKLISKRRSDKVDRSGRPGCKNYLFGAIRTDEFSHALARALVRARGLARERVNGPVRVSVVQRGRVGLHTDHALRPLGGSGVIEIDEGFSINLST